MEHEEEKYEQPNKAKDEAAAKADAERMELLRRAAETTGKQLRFDLSTGSLEEIDELREALGKSFEDPEQKWQVYYKGIRNVLMKNLPSGKEFKEARDIIYDEKNVFLNLGKKKSDGNGVRGSDSRMTFQPVMNEMLDLIVSWVSKSQNPFTLYGMLYALNEKHGYGHEAYDTTTQNFANAMRKLSEE
jgi:hypothetical protein